MSHRMLFQKVNCVLNLCLPFASCMSYGFIQIFIELDKQKMSMQTIFGI